MPGPAVAVSDLGIYLGGKRREKAVLQHTEHKPVKRRMIRNRQHLCFTIIGTLSAAVLASADPGYLPRVGPAPLRFRVAARPATSHFALPEPEIAPEPPPVAATPDVKPPVAVVTNSTAAETTVISSQIPVGPEPVRGDDVVSPQML